MTALLLDRPARPALLRMVTPAMVHAQIERLAEHAVETQDPRAGRAADALTGLPMVWDCLIEAAETLAELETGSFDTATLPWDVDLDEFEARQRADVAELLDELRDAAMWSLMAGAR